MYKLKYFSAANITKEITIFISEYFAENWN